MNNTITDDYDYEIIKNIPFVGISIVIIMIIICFCLSIREDISNEYITRPNPNPRIDV